MNDNLKIAKALGFVLLWIDVDKKCICNLLFDVYKYKGLISNHSFKLARRYLDENLPDREFEDEEADEIWYSWHPNDIESRKQWLTEQIEQLKSEV